VAIISLQLIVINACHVMSHTANNSQVQASMLANEKLKVLKTSPPRWGSA